MSSDPTIALKIGEELDGVRHELAKTKDALFIARGALKTLYAHCLGNPMFVWGRPRYPEAMKAAAEALDHLGETAHRTYFEERDWD